MATARAADDKVLVEAAVPGREIELAVLQGLEGAPPASTDFMVVSPKSRIVDREIPRR